MSSRYYWQLCDAERKKAREYKKNWKALEGIKKDLDRDFDNNVSDCNKKIGGCGEKLEDGIREVGTISSRVRELDQGKESDPDRDQYVSGASAELSMEISDLKKKQEDAEAAADHYAELARQAEREELAEMFSF